MTGWVGFDLDGTLAEWTGDVRTIGPPIPVMIERVKAVLAAGHEVRIFTARVGRSGGRDDGDFAADQTRLIHAWCLEHIGRILPVTATKDFGMLLLFDDRAITVETNTGRLCEPAYPCVHFRTP